MKLIKTLRVHIKNQNATHEWVPLTFPKHFLPAKFNASEAVIKILIRLATFYDTCSEALKNPTSMTTELVIGSQFVSALVKLTLNGKGTDAWGTNKWTIPDTFILSI